MATPRELLDRLDNRHDELIRKLDDLNAQIELALAQFGKAKPIEVVAETAPAAAKQTTSRRAA